jgi:hypothetical protein
MFTRGPEKIAPPLLIGRGRWWVGCSIAATLAGLLLGCDRGGGKTGNAPENSSKSSDRQGLAVEGDAGDGVIGLGSDLSGEKAGDFAPQTLPMVRSDGVTPPWVEELAEVAALGPKERAKAIFARFAEWPPEALAAASAQAVDGLPDGEYAAIVLPILTDPQTHGQALSVLFADLLERPDAIALPALVAIARNPLHSFGPSALDDLRLLLDADHGKDWGRWDAAVGARVAERPRR